MIPMDRLRFLQRIISWRHHKVRGRDAMIIEYQDGKTTEGFLLSRQENSMRVALEGSQDVLEFVEIDGHWVGENLEPVEITFEWQRQPNAQALLTDAEFICPKDLAAHLVRLLETDSKEEAPAPRYMTAGQSIM